MSDCILNEPHGMPYKEERAEAVQRVSGVAINHYNADAQLSGIALEYIQEVIKLVKEKHWDKSDTMTDYFSCSYYITIKIGKYNKAYKLHT